MSTAIDLNKISGGVAIWALADGLTVEFRRKPRWLWQHANLSVLALFGGKRYVEDFNTVVICWAPHKRDGIKIDFVCYVKRDGKMSTEALDHELTHCRRQLAEGFWAYQRHSLTKRGRLKHEAEALAAATITRYRNWPLHQFKSAWIAQRSKVLREDYRMRSLSEADVAAALLDAAGIEHTDGAPAEYRP